MVAISKQDENFIFTVQGMHKVWALKSQLVIPASDIVRVHRDIDSISWWKGFRFGTNIPFVLTAGTFFKWGEKNFWDVADKNNCIVVDLKDESYNHLIIEVENPEEAIKLLAS